MAKAVFIDFDGTFADRGRVPIAHARSVVLARANGHRVLLCTGRPRAMIPDSIASSFDGIVGAGGGYVEIEGEVLADVRFAAGLAKRVVSVLTQHDAVFILEAPEAVYASARTERRLEAILRGKRWATSVEGGAEAVLNPVVTCSSFEAIQFGKVSVFDSATPVPDLAQEIGPQVGNLPNSVAGISGSSGEIYLRGVNKAVGMALAAARLGVLAEDVIAIGDGYNDVEMLAEAGTALVVEDSPPGVLALADRVIPGPSHGGVAVGLRGLGLTAEPAGER